MATLGFSTNWPKEMGGKETNFISKIYNGLIEKSLADFKDYDDFDFLACQKGLGQYFPDFRKIKDLNPKLHTIREDSKNLWIPCRKIHMVVFNRSKNRFQFAPVLLAKSVQIIKITYHENICEQCGVYPSIFINGKFQSIDMMEKLAVNDGFESLQQFCQWFNQDFKGKIIHWTKLKY